MSLICMNCDREVEDQFDRFADCEATPDMIRFAAKAERRGAAGGPFAESHIWNCGAVANINRPDRRLPDPPCSRKMGGCIPGGRP
jgi:hypothetical protein